MTTALGFLSSLGVGKEATYGQAVRVTQRVPLLNENIDDNYDMLLDLSLQGRGAPRQPDQGNQHLKGTVKTKMRYTPENLLIENWMGSWAGGVYLPEPSTEDTGLTLAIDKILSVWEISGTKVGKLVVSGKAAGIEVDATVQGHLIDRASTINTETILQALIDPYPNILFPDLTFRIGPWGTTLNSSYDIGVSEFTVTMDRPFDEVFTNQQRTPIQPGQTAYRSVELDFKIPRYNTDQFQAWKIAFQRLHAEMTFTDATGTYTKQFVFPNLTLQNVMSPVAGPGIIPITVKAKGTEGEDPSGRTNDIEVYET